MADYVPAPTLCNPNTVTVTYDRATLSNTFRKWISNRGVDTFRSSIDFTRPDSILYVYDADRLTVKRTPYITFRVRNTENLGALQQHLGNGTNDLNDYLTALQDVKANGFKVQDSTGYRDPTDADETRVVDSHGLQLRLVAKARTSPIAALSYGVPPPMSMGYGSCDNDDFDGSSRVYVNANFGNATMVIHEVTHAFQSDLVENYFWLKEAFTDFFARVISESQFSGHYPGHATYTAGVILVEEMVKKYSLNEAAAFYFGGKQGPFSRFMTRRSEGMETALGECSQECQGNVGGARATWTTRAAALC